jgi:hypothetical protein
MGNVNSNNVRRAIGEGLTKSAEQEEENQLTNAITRSKQIETINKIAEGELSEDVVPTYVYFGHGEDTLVPNPNSEGEWMGDYDHDPVPADCIFISFVNPGNSSIRDQVRCFFSNLSSDEFITKLLNPVHYFGELSEVYRSCAHKDRRGQRHEMKNLKLFLRKPGEFYSENKFMPLGMWPTLYNDDRHLYTSGIYDVRDPRNSTLISRDPEPLIMKGGWSTLSEILTKYEGSVFPTPDDITQGMYRNYGSDVKAISATMLRHVIEEILSFKDATRQTDLFRLFPGIHYNTVCRYMDSEKTVSSSLRVARRLSLNRRRLLYPTEQEPEIEKVSVLVNFFSDYEISRILGDLIDSGDDDISMRTFFYFHRKPEILERSKKINDFFYSNNFTFDDILLMPPIPSYNYGTKNGEKIITSVEIKAAVEYLLAIGKQLAGGRRQTVKRNRSSNNKSKRRR